MMLSDSGLCARTHWISVNLNLTLSSYNQSQNLNFLWTFSSLFSWWTWSKVLLLISPNQMMLSDSGLCAKSCWTLLQLNLSLWKHTIILNTQVLFRRPLYYPRNLVIDDISSSMTRFPYWWESSQLVAHSSV